MYTASCMVDRPALMDHPQLAPTVVEFLDLKDWCSARLVSYHYCVIMGQAMTDHCIEEVMGDPQGVYLPDRLECLRMLHSAYKQHVFRELLRRLESDFEEASPDNSMFIIATDRVMTTHVFQVPREVEKMVEVDGESIKQTVTEVRHVCLVNAGKCIDLLLERRSLLPLNDVTILAPNNHHKLLSRGGWGLWEPVKVESFTLIGADKANDIANFLFRGNRQIRSISLLPSGACNPQMSKASLRISQGFVWSSTVQHLDITGLASVDRIEKSFCLGCDSLKRLVLPPYMANLRVIESSFLSGTAVKHLDLTPMVNLQSIGLDFCMDCTHLESIKFPDMPQVVNLQQGFLSGCSALRSVDLTVLRKIETIGTHFLFGCASITTLNFETFDKVREIPDQFLGGCRSLTELNTWHFRLITTIGSHFLSHCESLKELDSSNFSNVKTWSKVGFLDGCSSLSKFNYGPLMADAFPSL